jgi:hypothetical protein
MVSFAVDACGGIARDLENEVRFLIGFNLAKTD